MAMRHAPADLQKPKRGTVKSFMKNYENSKRNSISNNQQGISNVQGKKIWLKIITKAEMIKAASQLITL